MLAGRTGLLNLHPVCESCTWCWETRIMSLSAISSALLLLRETDVASVPHKRWDCTLLQFNAEADGSVCSGGSSLGKFYRPISSLMTKWPPTHVCVCYVFMPVFNVSPSSYLSIIIPQQLHLQIIGVWNLAVRLPSVPEKESRASLSNKIKNPTSWCHTMHYV